MNAKRGIYKKREAVGTGISIGQSSGPSKGKLLAGAGGERAGDGGDGVY